MANYFCYRCNQFRSLCKPGMLPGSCVLVEADALEYREEIARQGKSVYLGSVPGGTTDLAKKMDQTRQFHKDLYAFEDAKRAGEKPDGTTVKGVRSARQRVESFERAERKGYIERTG